MFWLQDSKLKTQDRTMCFWFLLWYPNRDYAQFQVQPCGVACQKFVFDNPILG